VTPFGANTNPINPVNQTRYASPRLNLRTCRLQSAPHDVVGRWSVRRLFARPLLDNWMFCVTYIETDVLIVGAGPAGLTATALLARLGVKSISVTKYDSTADSPRAHITNQRSMEIFRDLGFEDRVRARAMPQDLMGTQVFATSFAGLELARTRTWGAGVDNTWTEEITFVSSYGGSATPTWKLARISDLTLPFASRSEGPKTHHTRSEPARRSKSA
jgi:hypothetical protein